MDADNVFPADMPDDHLQPPVSKPMVPLDDDTAERLLAGHLHPEDAPPGYAEVARVLQAAAGPPAREELAGEKAALAGFRAARRGPTVTAGRRAPPGQGAGAVAHGCGPAWSPWPWPERWSWLGCGWEVGWGQPMKSSPP